MRKLETIAIGDVFISAITKSELEFGIAVSPRPERDRRSFEIFLNHIEVLDYPDQAAVHYGVIRAFLKARGTPIGASDLFIAAHARSLDLVLVTNSTREFMRIPGLKIENWAEPKQ